MKKVISTLLAVILLMSVLPGCTGQSNIPPPNGTPATSTPMPIMKSENVPDKAFSIEDYQKLLALKFDGYEEMSVSDYQNRVWTLTDTLEYRELLERFSHSEILYDMKDSNETAAFLFYILVPLTAENWESRKYGGFTLTDFPSSDNNLILEYSFTLTVLNAHTLTVGEYNTTRLNVISGIQKILKDKTEDDIQNVALISDMIQTNIDNLIQQFQTEEIGIAIEYAYFLLSAPSNLGSGIFEDAEDQEKRHYSNGSKDDYLSLLALKTPNYQKMALADFNSALLEWANEDYERSERIWEDIAWNDFQVALSDEEVSFVKLTVFLSGMENAAYIRSHYLGLAEEDPVFYGHLPQKTMGDGGYTPQCSIHYQFSYRISDKNAVTVGERDQHIQDMINAIEVFWKNTDIESLLKMSQSDMIATLKKIASLYSNEHITILINEEQFYFESMDERLYHTQGQKLPCHITDRVVFCRFIASGIWDTCFVS